MARFQDPLMVTQNPERMQNNKQLFDSSRWQQDPSSSSVEPQLPSSCTGENARTTVLTSSRSCFKFPDPPAIIPEYPLPVFFCVPPTQRTPSEERCRGKLSKFGQLPNWENEMMEQDIWPESFCKTRRMEQEKYFEPSSSSDIIHHPLPVYFRVKPALQTYESKKRGRKSRTLFTDLQLRVMEKVFSEQRYLDSTNRAKLAYILGLSEAQVKTWFQNRRMKWKKKVAKTGEKPDSSTTTKKAQETDPAET